MGRILLLTVALLLAPALAVPQPEVQAPAKGGVLLIDIEGGIGPATRDHLRRGLERASQGGAKAVVLRIDTPGGLDAATRDINRAILASEVPVIGWVAPQGARAASAGTYIMYASHLAAMAPATSLGAATPVSLGGPAPRGTPQPVDEETPRPETPGSEPSDAKRAKAPEPAAGRRDYGDAATNKAVNDAVSYLRSLAELRGRNTEFAEAAVREAATLTASQALSQGVIEIVAADLQNLLRQADGRTVRLGNRETVLATAGQPVTTLVPDWRVKLLAVISEPTVAYLLLLVGLYGLVFEGYSPGAIVPGTVGVICLLLALYALQVLPVNYAGVALIALGVVLIAAEFAMPSFGALGIGGLVALMVGSLILFDTDMPGYGVPGRLIVGIGTASALAFMGVIWLAARARQRPVVTGIEELVGSLAVATLDFHGRGQVLAHGETWQAESAVPVLRGQSVRVLALNGLVLRVAPADDANGQGRPDSTA